MSDLNITVNSIPMTYEKKKEQRKDKVSVKATQSYLKKKLNTN